MASRTFPVTRSIKSTSDTVLSMIYHRSQPVNYTLRCTHVSPEVLLCNFMGGTKHRQEKGEESRKHQGKIT